MYFLITFATLSFLLFSTFLVVVVSMFNNYFSVDDFRFMVCFGFYAIVVALIFDAIKFKIDSLR